MVHFPADTIEERCRASSSCTSGSELVSRTYLAEKRKKERLERSARAETPTGSLTWRGRLLLVDQLSVDSWEKEANGDDRTLADDEVRVVAGRLK